jgi:hypothetical protein
MVDQGMVSTQARTWRIAPMALHPHVRLPACDLRYGKFSADCSSVQLFLQVGPGKLVLEFLTSPSPRLSTWR